MPEDAGGTPSFPDGWEPDDDTDHGVTDEEFASVVFDEEFVRAAVVHEPSAVERLLAAARARAEASEARRDRGEDGFGPGFEGYDGESDDEGYAPGGYPGTYAPYGKYVRWHRPVAWLLALVMGVGMVVLAFAAVYRGASGGRDRVPSPATTGLEQGVGPVPGASAGVGAGAGQPAVSLVPPAP
uniref:SCO2584 family spore wall biosynthesis protein n=1 Tax=Streptomyces corallincola TaxID=2851888 RepID=UPI003FD6D36D